MKRTVESKTSASKRELILNTMRELFMEGTAGTASVSDIANKAGIAKGGIYYYFRSKEEIMDALIQEEYNLTIEKCKQELAKCDLGAIDQLALLMKTYRTSYVDPSLDIYLHQPQNAALHQKSLAQILISLSPIISEIFMNGVKEGTFQCDYPDEYADMMLSVFTFLLDKGIFEWTNIQYVQKLKALANLFEKGLQAPKESFSFLFNIATQIK